MQIEQYAILLPLTVGVGAIVFTIGIHAMALTTIIRLLRHERRLGRAGASFSIDMTIITVGILLALSAHLTEIALWAGIFEACAEFPAFAIAFYHSAVNYTSLGYGDIVMSHKWRFLAPLEATDGMLMFGISTAMIFTVIQGLVQMRFPDLRD
jgi:Ion channel